MSKKETCPECGKILRTRCFIFNIILKKKVCGYCHKRTGTNKFYTPQVKGINEKQRPTNYDIKWDEKYALYSELIRRGISPEAAKKRVNSRQKYVSWFQRSRNWNNKTKVQKDTDINKKMLEGLKKQ